MAVDSSQAMSAWTAFWRTGSGASCFEGSETELRLTRVWNEFVDGCADGARILDLATGNGTAARCCAARARERKIRLHIDAVDAAEIDPPKYAADPEQYFRDVCFRGGVRLEALPFPDGTFDGIVSQFGFEYADEVRAAGEAVRNLAQGGRLRLIMHARDGAVSRDIGLRVERLRSVLAERGPVALVLALARAAERGDVATLNKQGVYLAEAAEQVRELAIRPPPDDAALFYSREFLKLWTQRDRYWPSDLRRSLEDGWNNAKGVAIRQEQMLRAARSGEDMERLGARFAAADLILDGVRPVRDERRCVQVAWMMDAHKPANPPP
jgi:SAM-dependent methyltransferase